MPWIHKVKGVVLAWYGGAETGTGIADIVYGHVNPSGRMPLTYPVNEADVPAAMTFKSARTKTFYDDSIWVGYKGYHAKGIAPLFPFGHGLSYTTFEYSALKIAAPKSGTPADTWELKASVKVKNTGKVKGHHSVHFYTCPPMETPAGLRHPEWALQAFTKVYDLEPGMSATAEVTMDKCEWRSRSSPSSCLERFLACPYPQSTPYPWLDFPVPRPAPHGERQTADAAADAVTHWDEKTHTYRAEKGEWSVKVGHDAETMHGDAKFTIEDDLKWTGL